MDRVVLYRGAVSQLQVNVPWSATLPKRMSLYLVSVQDPAAVIL